MRGNRTALAGALVGLLGAGLLVVFVSQAAGRTAAPEPTVPVLLAGAPLAPDTTAEAVAGSVRRADMPASLAPARRLADLTDVAGQTVLRPVGEGEVLTLDQFGKAGPAAGGLVVPDGFEAISVEVDPAPGVEGYVTPGARVNVYAVLTEDRPAPGNQTTQAPFTQLVLGQVDVLAVTRGNLAGEAREPDGNAADTKIVLLLQVRPVDVPVLVHAQSHGRLWFTIANADDPPPAAVRVGAPDLSPEARTAAIAEAVAAQRARDAAAAAAAAPAPPAPAASATPAEAQ